MEEVNAFTEQRERKEKAVKPKKEVLEEVCGVSECRVLGRGNRLYIGALCVCRLV